MRTRKLGWTGEELTTIGLGTWAIGGSGWKFGWGPQDDKDSIKTIHKALDLGINWIDTARLYGLGHSEKVVGKALKQASSKPFIATKCGRVWDEKGNINGKLKKQSIRSEIEASLKALQIEVIDLYQIHWPMPDEDIEEGWQTISDLIKEGKIKYGGVCNFNIEQLDRIKPIHPITSCQPPYSMLKRDIEKELLDYCKFNKIGIVPYSPMQKGLLTGKFNSEHMKKLPQDDHRHNDPLFQEPQLGKNLELVDKLKNIAQRKNKSVAQLAIAWTLRYEHVTSAIVGARRPDQIEETAKAGDWVLKPEELNEIESLLEQYS
jgi:aryl-alcohol dehydrogenase-like predicted oxidoreductase